MKTIKAILVYSTCLILSGCFNITNTINPTKRGSIYKVKSGFYVGCTGIAIELSEFTGRTMLELTCDGELKSLFRYFNSSELEQIK